MRTWMMPLAVLALVCAGCSQNNSSEYQPYQAQPYGSSDTHATLAALEPMDQPATTSRRPAPASPKWQPGKMRYDAVIPVERVTHLEPSTAASSDSETTTYAATYDQTYSSSSSSSYDEPLNPSTSGYASSSSYSGGGNVHTVAKGDTLYSLARRYYGADARWRDIYNANRGKLRSPDAIQIGMQLVIP